MSPEQLEVLAFAVQDLTAEVRRIADFLEREEKRRHSRRLPSLMDRIHREGPEQQPEAES